jgi:hypothetical protein
LRHSSGKSVPVYQTPPVDELPEKSGPAMGVPVPRVAKLALPEPSKVAAHASVRHESGGRECMNL